MSEPKRPVPRLRFPEFRDAGPWEVTRLGEVGTIVKGKGVSKSDISEQGALPCIRYGELYTHYSEVIRNVLSFTNVDAADLLLSEENDVIIPASGETTEDIATASCVMVKGVALGGDLNIFRSPVNGVFLAYYIRGTLKPAIAKIAQGISVVHLYPTQLVQLELALPHSEEQQKIADCLTSLDDLIRAEEEAVEALRDHKRGLMQQLFPRAGETTPRLRFPEFRDAGPWEVKRLGEISTRRTERNHDEGITRVLTNSAEHGVLDQRDYFKKDIAIKGNLGTYFVVYKGDFVYNPRVSKTAPVGPISRNDVGEGVMSPLYTVFCFESPTTDFFAYYFLSTSWHSYLRAVGSTGARHDRMAVSNDDFMAMPVPVPPENEQQKIADCLTSLDDLIRAREARLDALRAHKTGLMQQLFPQEVR